MQHRSKRKRHVTPERESSSDTPDSRQEQPAWQCLKARLRPLTIADLLKLVGKEAIPVWSNEQAQSYLLPWEATLLSLLLTGPVSARNSSRFDVSLVICLGQILATSERVMSYAPYVVVGENLLSTLIVGPTTSLTWRYDGKVADAQSLLAALRDPVGCTAPLVAQLGILPRKEDLLDAAVVSGAFESDDVDIYKLAVDYWKRSNPDADYAPRDLRTLAKKSNPERYVPLIGGVDKLVNNTSPAGALWMTKSAPSLFRLVCEALHRRGVDLHSLGRRSPAYDRDVSLATSLAYAPASFRVFLEYYRPKEDLSNLGSYLRRLLNKSLDSARILIKRIEMEEPSLGSILNRPEQHGELLAEAIRMKRTYEEEFLTPIEVQHRVEARDPSAGLVFVVTATPAIGFDLKIAIKNLVERSNFRWEFVTIADLRYIFGTQLSVDGTKELVKPEGYAHVFSYEEARQYARDELGLAVP